MMDSHTFEVLEFDKIREILGAKASSSLGKDAAMRLTPFSTSGEIGEELDAVAQLRDALDSGTFSIGPIKDIREAVKACRLEGSILAPEDIYNIAVTLKTSRLARTCFDENEDTYPLLASLGRSLLAYSDFENAAVRSVSEDGQILDTASSNLASIRRRRERIKETIRDKLEGIMKSERTLIQDDVVTMRQERYVIPLKSEGKSKLKCIVHDVSASGATFFVEPLAVLDLNNELQENKKDEADEIARILAALTGMVRAKSAELERCIEALTRLDLLLAKARFASEFNCTRPQITDSGMARIELGVHPLLLRKKGFKSAVPLDLSLGEDFDTLLISGPNAGGKTVALKTVGILTLLVQCGMHVPVAAGSSFPVFRKIFADIGDEQSIERDLSTFSSHISNIVKIMKEADSSTLVLLDELGVGTDPRSGTGIAMAVLTELTERGVKTIATSHYGDLKIFVQASEGMENASVEFDPETLRPTYRLRIGVPGSSNTFEIAQRLGMDARLMENARKFAGESSSRAEEIIASLEKSLVESEKLAREAGLERTRLEALVQDYETRLDKVRAEEKDAKKRRTAQSRQILEKARATVENIVKEIKESQAETQVVRQAKKTLDSEIDRLREPRQARPAEPLKPGENVFVEPFGAAGKVLAVFKGAVQVEVGRVRCQVPLYSVRRVEAEAEEPPAQVRVPDSAPPPEITLIGMDREEALELLDRYIDRAFLSGLATVRIVHGKGRGILKAAIEEALSADSRVDSFRQGAREEGGWGVTIAKLKT